MLPDRLTVSGTSQNVTLFGGDGDDTMDVNTTAIVNQNITLFGGSGADQTHGPRCVI